MTQTDVLRWQKKYQDASLVDTLQSDNLLLRYEAMIKNRGLALDLAAGTCHSSVQLAQSKNKVIAVDCSITALQLGQQLANRYNVKLIPLVADLSCWSAPSCSFDMITCFRYLDRKMFPVLVDALKPRGLLIYKTFNEHYLNYSPRFNPKYVLRPGELEPYLSQLEIIECSDGASTKEIYSFAVCRKSNSIFRS